MVIILSLEVASISGSRWESRPKGAQKESGTGARKGKRRRGAEEQRSGAAEELRRGAAAGLEPSRHRGEVRRNRRARRPILISQPTDCHEGFGAAVPGGSLVTLIGCSCNTTRRRSRLVWKCLSRVVDERAATSEGRVGR